MQTKSYLADFKHTGYLIILGLLCFVHLEVNAQIFNNPSFEGVNGLNTAPPQWSICGATPDLLPAFTAIFPSDGNSCVGMLRFIGHDESIGQQLPTALDSTKCYSFDLDLRNGSPYGFTVQPGKMAIWFGDTLCDKQFLAWTSPFITHAQYVTYSIFFQPDRNYTHAIFEIQPAADSTQESAIGMDNIHNQIVSTSTIDLGGDRLVCLGDSLLLDASGTNLSYLWNNGSTDSVLWVKGPGVYSVTVTDLNGCQKNDEIVVVYPDTLNLGADTILCDSDSFLLVPNIKGSNYLWQDGSTDSVLYAVDSGLYYVSVTRGNCIQTDSIHITKNNTVQLDLGADTVLCIGDTLLLDASVNGGTYLWQDNSTAADFVVRSTGVYHVRVKVADCFYFDTIQVSISNLNNIDLGMDTSVCRGDSILLSVSTINGANITWSNNQTGASIWVGQDGKYWADVSIGSCTVSDTINVNFRNTQQLDVDLGNDTLLCLGASFTLDVTHPNASYLWQDLSISNTYLIDKPGTYWVTVNENGCIDSDTLLVNTIDTLDLGADTTICVSDSLLIQTNLVNSNYLWQDNSTNSFIMARDSGLYKVTVTTNACIQTDSVQLDYFPTPNFSLGKDTMLCNEETLLLDVANPNSSYLWQDNSTNSSFTISDSGLYHVTLTQFGCEYKDSVSVEYRDLRFDLGADTLLCLSDSIVLEVTPPAGANVLWFNNTTANQVTIKQSGKFWARLSQDMCEAADTILVSYRNTTRPNIQLGNDTILCLSDSLQLNAFWSNSSSYLWQDGSQNSNLWINRPGIYSVSVSDNNCDDSDSIEITYADTIDLVFPNNTFCQDQGLLVDFTYPSATYLWQDGSTNPTYLINDTGLYWVQLNVDQCQYQSDSVYFRARDCRCLIELPNVFSPNGDGINDEFFVESDCDLTDYKLYIFNRYGKQIVEADFPSFRWDGKAFEEKVSTGMYYYLIQYRGEDKQLQEYRGSLTLIR